jgi:hypothetical protein
MKNLEQEKTERTENAKRQSLLPLFSPCPDQVAVSASISVHPRAMPESVAAGRAVFSAVEFQPLNLS